MLLVEVEQEEQILLFGSRAYLVCIYHANEKALEHCCCRADLLKVV
jgi:hypothetical protein